MIACEQVYAEMNVKTIANISFCFGISVLALLIFYMAKNDNNQKHDTYEDSSEIEISSAEIKYLDKQKNISTIEAIKVTKNADMIKAEDMHFKISKESGNLIINAKSAIKEADVVLFSGDVRVIFDEETTVSMSKAKAVLNEKKIYIDVPVTLNAQEYSIISGKCKIDWSSNDVFFCKNVKMHINDSTCICDNALVHLSLDTSKKYNLDSAVLKKNIIANLHGYNIRATDKMTILKDRVYTTGKTTVESKYKTDNFKLDTTDMLVNLDKNKKISKILCKNSFVFSTKDNIIKGANGVLIGDKIIIRNKLQVISKNGEITGDSGEYDLRTKKAKIFTTSGVFFQSKKWSRI